MWYYITIREERSITMEVKQIFHFKHKVHLTSHKVTIDSKFHYTMRVLNFPLT